MEILRQEQYGEYEAFVKAHRAGSFMQSVRWTKVKYNWGHQIVVSRDAAGAIRGGMLILIRKVPLGRALLYAPRGPVCDLHDREVIADLLEGAKEVAKCHKGYLFKMDPYVLTEDEGLSGWRESWALPLPRTWGISPPSRPATTTCWTSKTRRRRK